MKPKSKKKPLQKSEAPEEPIIYDVLGSYTGIPADGGYPVQDADDL